MIDKYIYKILGFFDNWSEKLDRVFFPPKKKRKKDAKIVIANVIVIKNYMHIGMMAIYVLVITANIKDFMRCNYGIFTDKTRMFVQKTIWSCLAMANKIYS